jgi:hypothetical protein
MGRHSRRVPGAATLPPQGAILERDTFQTGTFRVGGCKVGTRHVPEWNTRVAGDKHYISLYREHVPILLKAVPEANRRNLYPAGRLSARDMNAEEKQLSESIELP